jgi:hypothetical protein
MIETWERQKEESTQAFEAYVMYRDLGDERSTSKVAQSLSKSKSLIDGWSGKWSWVKRCEDYERMLDRMRVKAQVKAQREMVERHANISVGLQGQVAKALTELVKSGAVAKMDVYEMAKVMELSSRVERLSRGLPSDAVQQIVDVADHDNLSEAALNDPTTRVHLLALAKSVFRQQGQSSPFNASPPGDVPQPGPLDPAQASGVAQ